MLAVEQSGTMLKLEVVNPFSFVLNFFTYPLLFTSHYSGFGGIWS